ncbi:MAG TPA: 50S ribosomal protein L11 methyltransferase [Candidatus Saccharimonadales bacterium]|jgi:SAM-dependent methyltransferase|nr:50S ribosomal protein L11 methyltransferase [Candidatus Saccharimonadales bacterium]
MQRFEFGKNWQSFLSVVTEQHVSEATERLSELLGNITGKTFLDVGCGSGIQSLAALRLGASRVLSFDYDAQSVACTAELKRRFAPNANWQIETGSALDEEYLRSLGLFSIVYSWGVLHHTGDLWRALDLVTIPANETLALCVYNDQGTLSRAWRRLKRSYVQHPFYRPIIITASLATIWGPKLLLLPHRVIPDWRNWKRKRGMSPWHDVIDWAGGYPYEFSNKDRVIEFYQKRGFYLSSIKRFGRILTMYEYVFTAQDTQA